MSAESISVMKVRDILLVTALQERILQAMERYETKGLILDISTVETLDSFFARTVTETTQMVALMGGQTVIAGMQPSVAITTTQLGLTLGNARAALNVDRALDILESIVGRGGLL